MTILLVLVIILVLFEVYALLLQCRNGHSGLKELRLFRYAHRGFHEKPDIPENSMAAFAGRCRTTTAWSWMCT